MEQLDFAALPPPLEESPCAVVPRHIGLDMDSQAYHLYFLTEQIPVHLYSPPENAFQCFVTNTATLHALPEEEIERAAGDKSPYGLYMAAVRAKVLRFFDAGIGMPVPALGALHRPWMERVALILTDVAHYRTLLHGRQRKDALLETIAQAADNIRQVNAILRVLRRVALDLCAFIGAVELPYWDSSPELAGIVLYSHKFPEYGHRKLAEIATLERWGIPIWIVERCEQHSRLELDASSRPSSHPGMEKMYQERLALVRGTGVKLEEAYLHEGKTVIHRSGGSRRSLYDDDEESIDNLILLALMPGPGEEGMAFDDFAYRLKQKMSVLRAVAWSNWKYEDGKHGAVEGRLWHRSRYYPFETRNTPAFFAQRTVPPHYHDPTLPIPKWNGALPEPLPYPATVPNGTWYGVELRFFDRLSLIGEVTHFHPSILAYHTARTTVSAAEGGYEEGGEKPFVLQFWGKDKSELDLAMQSLPGHLRGKMKIDLIPNSPSASSHWVSLVNTQYISLVLASPRSKAVREGLLGMMPKAVQPASGDPAYRPGKVRYVHYLRHFLIGKGRWEPLASSSEAGAPEPCIMDRFEFTGEYLQNLVTKPRPISFSLSDYIEFHRVQIVLEMLTGLGSFRVQLVANKGPLSRICRRIAENVRSDSSNNLPGCKFTAAGEADSMARMEQISWAAGRPMLALFLNDWDPDLRPLSHTQLWKWEEQEDKILTTELAKKKHQPSAGASSSNAF